MLAKLQIHDPDLCEGGKGHCQRFALTPSPPFCLPLLLECEAPEIGTADFVGKEP